MYAFHMNRNYRKAGTVMFEYGMRLGREVRTIQGLQKQVSSYVACLTSLRMIRPEKAWIMQPTLGLVCERPRTLPKRNHDGEQLPGPRSSQIHILELKDLEKEYTLAQMRLTLAQHDPSTAAIVGTLSADEMVPLLVHAGLFDSAFSLCQTFNLPLTSVFEGIAFKCLKLHHGNQRSSVVTTKESSATDEAWRLMTLYLEKYKSKNGLYHRCIINKLLSHGFPLPNWLINSYKAVDVASLLRLYLRYDLLNEATELVLEYVNAVLNKGPEYFEIKSPLSHTSKFGSIWLPYSAINQLMQALAENPSNQHNAAMLQKFRRKMVEYFLQLDIATQFLLAQNLH